MSLPTLCAKCLVRPVDPDRSVCFECYPKEIKHDCIDRTTCQGMIDSRDSAIHQQAEIIYQLRRECVRLQNQLQAALSAVSNGWMEAWHDGNQFMALPPDDNQETVMRAWELSKTLKMLQAIRAGKYDKGAP